MISAVEFGPTRGENQGKKTSEMTLLCCYPFAKLEKDVWKCPYPVISRGLLAVSVLI